MASSNSYGLNRKLTFLCGVIVNIMLCSSVAFAQENCSNSIDDDGDGLIDFNDSTDCFCNSSTSIPSLIPNSSFEQMNCCPSSYSQVNCATGWSQATDATSDYMNNCGFVFGAATSAGLVPFPDGDGILGAIFSPGWQEYVGSCLSQPMISGDNYTLEMNIASTPINGSGGVCNGGVVNYGPIDITIFGHPTCMPLPVSGTDCPMIGSGADPDWVVIGTATYNPLSAWGTLTFNIAPSVDINTIMIGSPCTLPADYNNPGGCYPYFYFDNLLLYEPSLINQINTLGNWCTSDLRLYTSPIAGATYQWYQDGVALSGETDTLLDISSNGLGIGWYTIVTDSAGTCASVSDSVSIPPLPSPAFSAGSACEGGTTAFSDLSSLSGGSVTSWDWDFGDGTVENQQNPTHTYSGNGNFNVNLVVTGSNGCIDSIQNMVSVNPQPVSDLFVSGSSGPATVLGIPNGICPTDSVYFTDNSSILTGSIASWDWDYGNGLFSSASTGASYYSSAGVYNVELTVTSDSGCVDSTEISFVVNEKPNASFSTQNECSLDTVTFNDLSTVTNGNILAWSWDFGNGGTSTVQNPAYIYNAPGSYSVILISVSDSGCSDTATQSVQSFPVPFASFSVNNNCISDQSVFSDLSTIQNLFSDSIVAWNWLFDDGMSSASASPTHQYTTSGSFSPTLTVITDKGCSDDTIIDLEVHPLPTPQFTTANVCSNTPPATFSDNSSVSPGNVVSWFWDFGDGNSSIAQNPSNSYATSGNYTVELRIISDSGCTDSISKSIVVNQAPTAGFTVPFDCVEEQFLYTDNSLSGSGAISTWQWSFGDGNMSVQNSPSHVYLSAGTFSTELIVTNDSGCTDTSIQQIDVYPLPLSSFSFTPVCLNETTVFTDQSSVANLFGDVITTFVWNFGDGNNSSSQNPSHTFANDGIFNATLIVLTDKGCVDDTTVQVEVYPLPIADFGLSDLCLNEPPNLFTDSSSLSSGNIAFWNWDFGDGSTGTSQNPSHSYAQNGSYPVELQIESDNGCKDSLTQTVTVFPLPQMNFSATVTAACEPMCTELTDLSVLNGASIVSWTWNASNGDDSNDTSATFCFNDDGVYDVGLMVVTSDGCKDTLIKPNYITAFPLPIALYAYTPDSSTILFTEFEFFNQSGGNIGSWFWEFYDNNGDDDPLATSSLINPTYTFPEDTGLFPVELVVTTVNGCKDSIVKLIQIDPELIVFLPNAFTPDNDGINDFFFPIGTGISPRSNFRMLIYNRWGEVIFESQRLDDKWDGTARRAGGTTPVEMGVYVWQIEIEGLRGREKFSKVGHVTLVR